MRTWNTPPPPEGAQPDTTFSLLSFSGFPSSLQCSCTLAIAGSCRELQPYIYLSPDTLPCTSRIALLYPSPRSSFVLSDNLEHINAQEGCYRGGPHPLSRSLPLLIIPLILSLSSISLSLSLLDFSLIPWIFLSSPNPPIDHLLLILSLTLSFSISALLQAAASELEAKRARPAFQRQR